MSKLKIVFVLSRFTRGGAEKNILFLISNLDTQLFDIHLILFAHHFKDFDKPKNVNVVVLNRSLFFGVWKLRKTIVSLSPDVLFSTVSYFNIFLAINRVLLLPNNIKYVAREANMLSLLNKDEGFLKGYLFGTLIAKLVYGKGFDLFVAQSEVMKLDMITNFNIPDNKIVVIPNPAVDISSFGQKGSQLNKDKNLIKLVTVGRLHKQKGIDRLLEVLKELPDNFILDVYGEGPEENSLMETSFNMGLDRRVDFKGFVADVQIKLKEYDLFLLGSRYEGFPNIVLECSLVGLPVISFKCHNLLEGIIHDDLNGLIIRDDSVKTFSRGVVEASGKIWDNEAMLQHVKDNFAPSNIIQSYTKLLLNF